MEFAKSESMKAKVLTVDEVATLFGWHACNVPIRFAVLGYSEICGRCGGSGKHSYNAMHGDMCYGCSGKGKVLPKLTPALVSEIKAKVDAGALNAYLEEQARAIACRKAIKPTMEAIEAAWSKGAIHTAYEAAYRTCYVTYTTTAIDSVVYDYANRINALWDNANKAARNTKTHADKLLEQLQGILEQINSLNAEFEAN